MLIDMERENEVMGWVMFHLGGEKPVALRRELYRWLQADPRNKADFDRALELCHRSRAVAMAGRIDPVQAWDATNRRIGKIRSLRRRVRALSAGVAAAAVLAAALIWFPGGEMQEALAVVSAEPGSRQAVLKMSDGTTAVLSGESNLKLIDATGAEISIDEENNIKYADARGDAADRTNTIYTPRGGIFSVILSDGTKVWLNSDSELTYPVKFGRNGRRVELRGEGYFEVASDASNPFTVQCGGHSVVATGTRFQVTAYGPHTTEATLLEGRVTLSDGAGREERLSPGHRGVISGEGIATALAEGGDCTAWVRGMFEFENRPLAQIVEILSRWYNVEFRIADAEMGTLRFTASVPASENLSFIIELFERISSARFANADGKVVVSSAK